ncbi:uncharacterized protein LOC110703840 [Chenopodium quinoa]|uniref:uncharacterized protein LOC110703840 n=1 Tax=Chenopodium quinoa TaxID=63459 RepID=UPI000B76E7DE|nr:uncharacterized protein LOC110703840 [Chenopodium quinoa]
MIGTLDSSIVPLVSRATTTKEAWDILAHTFARHSRGHAKLVKANMKAITKGTQTITEYMNAIRICVDQLAVLGEPYKLDDLIERVLEGLDDDKYQSVIDSVNGRDTVISFDELHEKLLIKEVSIRKTSTSTPLPVTAHATTTRSHPPNTYPTDSYNRNSYPNPPKSDAPYKKHNQTNTNTKPQGYQGKCQWCHTLGHSLYRCPIFQEKFSNAKPTLPPSSTSQRPPQAHVATTAATSQPTNWLLDTGASHHVTHDLSNLSLHHPYDGTEEIVIGSAHGGTSYQGSN